MTSGCLSGTVSFGDDQTTHFDTNPEQAQTNKQKPHNKLIIILDVCHVNSSIIRPIKCIRSKE